MILRLLSLVTLFLCTALNAYAGNFSLGAYQIEYWHNHPLDTPADYFDKAVIVIHGANRNADEYYDAIVNAAHMENQFHSTLIVAPQFKTPDDNPGEQMLYWSQTGWKIGYKAKNGNRTSSFAVIDSMLEQIDRLFPSIKQLTIVGHSAGGQFVQRYAALNTQEDQLRSGLQLRYVAANPSSWLYLDASRPASTVDCLDYDNYRYGIADLPGTLAYTTLDPQQIRSQLLSRSVFVLLGQEDNDTGSGSLNTSCKANAQGAHRLERGRYYMQHILGLDAVARHHKIEVPNIGHSYSGMFYSEQGRAALFPEQIAAISDEAQILENAVPVSNLAAKQGQYRYFSIDTPARADVISFSIEGGQGDADLYVRKGQRPDLSAYDCSPQLEGNREHCNFPDSPSKATWHIMLYAKSSYSDLELRAHYQKGGRKRQKAPAKN